MDCEQQESEYLSVLKRRKEKGSIGTVHLSNQLQIRKVIPIFAASLITYMTVYLSGLSWKGRRKRLPTSFSCAMIPQNDPGPVATRNNDEDELGFQVVVQGTSHKHGNELRCQEKADMRSGTVP